MNRRSFFGRLAKVAAAVAAAPALKWVPMPGKWSPKLHPDQLVVFTPEDCTAQAVREYNEAYLEALKKIMAEDDRGVPRKQRFNRSLGKSTRLT